MRAQALAAVLLSACAGQAVAQDASQDAPRVNDNPPGVGYKATLPKEPFFKDAAIDGNVKGYIHAQATDSGQGVKFMVKFSNLPKEGGPFSKSKSDLIKNDILTPVKPTISTLTLFLTTVTVLRLSPISTLLRVARSLLVIPRSLLPARLATTVASMERSLAIPSRPSTSTTMLPPRRASAPTLATALSSFTMPTRLALHAPTSSL